MKSEPGGACDGGRMGLSALMDGEAGVESLREALKAWREESVLRETWHTYAVIGDVLRSEDLASHDVRRDQRFLTQFRERMTDEPVILSPKGVSVPPHTEENALGGFRGLWLRSHRPWTATAAIAAGCVMVAGAGMVWRGGSNLPAGAGTGDTSQMTQVTTPGLREGPAALAASATLADWEGVSTQRNVELDRYLFAHREFTQGPALAAPGGVRQVSLTPAE